MKYINNYDSYRILEFIDPISIGAMAIGVLAFGLYSSNQMNTFKILKLQNLHIYDKQAIKDSKNLMEIMKKNLTKEEIDRLITLIEKIENNPKIKKIIDSFYDMDDDNFNEMRKKEKEMRDAFKNNINEIFTPEEYKEFKIILSKIKN